MGNIQNRSSTAESTSAVTSPPSGATLNSSTVAYSAALERGFKAYVSAPGKEKSVLSKQDFTDLIFAAIPDVGKFVYKYLVSPKSSSSDKDKSPPSPKPAADENATTPPSPKSALSKKPTNPPSPKLTAQKTKTQEATVSENAENIKTPAKQKMYIKGGIKIFILESDAEQMEFFAELFTKGRNVITLSELVTFLGLCQQASWLSCGLQIPPTEKVREDLETIIKNMFKGNASVSISDFCSWTHRSCPRLVTDLHSYICSCLVGDKKSFVVKENVRSELVSICQTGHSLINLSSLWLLTSVVPPSFFPSMTSSSSYMPMSNIAVLIHNNSWHSLYNSNSQGLSVNRFQHHVFDYTGPTLMFLSFDRYVYAVAIDTQWKESSHHWGGPDGMCLQMKPEYKLVQSGDGLMYVNFTERTAPKGLYIGKDARTTFLKIDEELVKVNHFGLDCHLSAIEIWGCGGQECLSEQFKQKAWEHKEVVKIQNRKLIPEDWKDNPDRDILEMGGVTTRHEQRGDI